MFFLGLSGGVVTLRPGDLAILQSLLKPATPHWKEVGLSLGFNNSDLATIELMPLLIPKGPTGYFSEMLNQWLNWAPPNHPWPTGEALVVALQNSGDEQLAEFIERLKGNVRV